jgi:hypothetical protein
MPPFAPRAARHWVNPARGQSFRRLPNLTILHRGAKLFNAMDWLFVLGHGQRWLDASGSPFHAGVTLASMKGDLGRTIRACPEKVARPFSVRTCSISLILSRVLIDQMVPFDRDAL